MADNPSQIDEMSIDEIIEKIKDLGQTLEFHTNRVRTAGTVRRPPPPDLEENARSLVESTKNEMAIYALALALAVRRARDQHEIREKKMHAQPKAKNNDENR